MGYTTKFEGCFELDRQLDEAHYEYLVLFSETRRIRRSKELAEKLKDPVRIKANLPIGEDGAYFVGGTGFAGQDNDKSVINYNGSPTGQPGLRCQWVPNEDGTAIEWDGGEKFYDYIDWIKYLVDNFLGPWGYKVNGEVNWSGEEAGDTGTITIKDNVVTALSTKEKEQKIRNEVVVLTEALKTILEYEKNPIRRNQYAGTSYKAPDWIQTKDAIFTIAENALKQIKKV